MKNQYSKLEPRKRTAIDGKMWWCVYDLELNKYSTLLCFGKYRTKTQCDTAILYFQKGLKGV